MAKPKVEERVSASTHQPWAWIFAPLAHLWCENGPKGLAVSWASVISPQRLTGLWRVTGSNTHTPRTRQGTQSAFCVLFFFGTGFMRRVTVAIFMLVHRLQSPFPIEFSWRPKGCSSHHPQLLRLWSIHRWNGGHLCLPGAILTFGQQCAGAVAPRCYLPRGMTGSF